MGPQTEQERQSREWRLEQETIEQKKARRHQHKTHSLPTRVLRLEDASKNEARTVGATPAGHARVARSTH